MEKPEIRFFLVVSTAHLPQELVDHDVPGYLDSWGTPGVHEFEHGFFLWVPDDPKESAECSPHAVHAQVLAIQLHARALNCDYVMIDADGPVVETLSSFDWERGVEITPAARELVEQCEQCGAALVDGSCPKCGIYHDPDNACPACGAAGWHKPSCPTMQDADDASLEELETASAILDREGARATAEELLQEWIEYAVTVGIDPDHVPVIGRTRALLTRLGRG